LDGTGAAAALCPTKQAPLLMASAGGATFATDALGINVFLREIRCLCAAYQNML
jgi:hypothetical protein